MGGAHGADLYAVKPDDWTFSLAGITAASPRSKDSNGRILKELEQHGYLRRVRDYGHGKLGGMIYEIYEEPFQPMEEPEITAPEKPVQLESRAKARNITAPGNAVQQNPAKENQDTVSGSPQPFQETAIPEIPAQQFAPQSFPTRRSQPLLSTELTKTERTKTEKRKVGIARDQSIYQSLGSIEECEQVIRDNLSYPLLCEEYGSELVDCAVNLIVDTLISKREFIPLGGDLVPAPAVQRRLMNLEKEHLEYVFDCMKKTSGKIHNIRSYLMKALYNAPTTMDAYYAAEVNHDFSRENTSSKKSVRPWKWTARI